jgi:membrane associated rhomboid family serine protease
MLDDRPYMRPDYRPGGSFRFQMPLSILMMIVLIAAFALQEINVVYFRFDVLRYLALSNIGLRHGYVWQLLTFQFLHGGTLHLLFNLMGIWFFCRPVEQQLGQGHFLRIYFLGGVVGGLLQSLLAELFPLHFGFPVVGASAGVSACIAAFSLIQPDATILAYMVLPVRAIYLLYIDFAYELFYTLVPADGIAHPAHLGGIIFAVAYMRWGLNAASHLSDWNPFRRRFPREKIVRAAAVTTPRATLRRQARLEDAPELSEEFISKEVDPILDKISAHGIQSLTERERQILQAARAKMSKR